MKEQQTETRPYSLPELVHTDIDSWVEAMSNLASLYGGEVDGYNPDEDCPADYEAEFYVVAEKHGVLFTGDGEIYGERN